MRTKFAAFVYLDWNPFEIAGVVQRMRKASPLTAELQEQIDKLGPEEKKYLLQRLIADLDGCSDESSDEYSAEEISAAWLQEAQRRCRGRMARP